MQGQGNMNPPTADEDKSWLSETIPNLGEKRRYLANWVHYTSIKYTFNLNKETIAIKERNLAYATKN